MARKQSSRTDIKEMARQLGLAPGTVSVVLNGRGDSVRISKETQKRILDLAKEMNYQPNIYARRLRKAALEEPPVIIAIFWRRDNLNSRLGKLLDGMYQRTVEKERKVEMVVQPYEAGEFASCIDQLSANRFSAAVIGGISLEEQERLEGQEYDIPIILIGRDTNKFHCVLMDNYRAGEKCAQMLDAEETKSAAVIGFKRGGRPDRLLEAGFIFACQDRGIEVREEWNCRLEKSSYETGYQVAEELLSRMQLPAAWLALDSRLAAGILEVVRKRGIRIPEELKLIFLEESELLKYNRPSLSSVDVPIEQMAKIAMDILFTVVDNQVNIPIKRELLPIYHIRESMGNRGEEKR